MTVYYRKFSIKSTGFLISGTLNVHSHTSPEGWCQANYFFFNEITFAFGDQGALFEKTAPWTPAKAFD